MPTRPGHTCVPGCPVIVPYGQKRCPRHTAVERRMKERGRGSRHERGYGTPWDRLRASWFDTVFDALGKRKPVLCGDRMTGPASEHSLCLQKKRTSTARVLDHIVPREEGGPDEFENFQSLCDRCHNVKRQQEGTRARR